MVLLIIVIVLVGGIAFFHFVQGFFSAAISAILSIFSAVVSVSYFETLLEGPVAGVSPTWMPSLLLLGVFGVTYIVLRTIIDKVVPGGVQLPAAADKVGGALMGVVAGIYAVGVVVLALSNMPLGSAIAGYTRYQTTDLRGVALPPSGRGKSSRDAATYYELDGNQFDPAKIKPLLLPVDDIVVGTVARLSGIGALNTGKPFTDIHPDYLQELYGQRAGVENNGNPIAVNATSKNRSDVTLVNVFRAPPTDPSRVVDHEFKRVRGTPLTAPMIQKDELRVVVRVKFASTAADAKDRMIRLSPAAVRLVAKQPSLLGGELESINYFPIGTFDPTGTLYLNKVDDFLFIRSSGKKVDGSGEGPSEVDFVFQVKAAGFVQDPTAPQPKILDGVFVEVKKLARVDLSGSEVKTKAPPLQVFSVLRKHLEWDGGLEPAEPGKMTAPVAAAPAATLTGGGGVLGQRLAGTWETRNGIAIDETITFGADGAMSSVKAGATTAMRWAASGAPQGETLNITTAPDGSDPASGEKRTITFTDDNQFEMTGADGSNRRFKRVGAAASAAEEGTPAPAASASPDLALSKMVGTWENAAKLRYTFRADGSYEGTDGGTGKSGGGTWRVVQVIDKGNVTQIELTSKTGKINQQQWNIAGDKPAQITRIDTTPPTVFDRK